MRQLDLRDMERTRMDPDSIKAVMAALDTVMDPELDESVAAMGFIESVAVDARRADIVFRLPTFWCSANFAFLMATDMRCAVEQLPEVDTACVRLVDHFAAGKINRGVAEGLGFSAVFSGEARTDLVEIRRAFHERAFLGRQEKILKAVVAKLGIAAALSITMAELEALTSDGDPDIRVTALRYFALRRHEKSGGDADAPAFITLEGAPIEPENYLTHLRTLRRIKGAAEANAEMCRLYLEARISHPVPGYESDDRKEKDDE